MTTIVSSTEFENMWNTMIGSDDEYHKTHWAIGCEFTLAQIEKNKPEGWNELRKVINDIEKDCVVYYFCKKVIDYYNVDEKELFFIVYGDNAIENCNKIAKQCNKMRECHFEKEGGGRMNGANAAQCPLF